MDAHEAHEALNEVRARETQVAAETQRQGSAWWYLTGLAAAFVVSSTTIDLTEGMTGWAGQVISYAVPVLALAVIVWLFWALRRSMEVHSRAHTRRSSTYLIALLVAFAAVYMGVGTLLRLYDIGWDSAISGVVAAVVFLGGALALPRVPARRSPADSQRAE